MTALTIWEIISTDVRCYYLQLMENGLNYVATAFVMSLVQRCYLESKSNNEGDFLNNSIETLSRIASVSRQAPDG